MTKPLSAKISPRMKEALKAVEGMKHINWNISKEDLTEVDLVIARAKALDVVPQLYEGDMQTFQMDLIACHLNGCPLDFQKLVDAPVFDFVHDLVGIAHHINRETAELEHFFLPRCARPTVH